MKHTLLIVEDDLDTSEMLRVYFEAQGYQVILATTGQEALDKNLILMALRLEAAYKRTSAPVGCR